MSAPKQYDVNQVTMSFFGLLIDSGFSDGDVLSIEADETDWKDKAGADGEVVRTRVNNPLGRAKVTLMQTSEGNTKLAAVRAADLASNNGAGVGPFLVKDKSGTSLYKGTCWIEGPPSEVKFGAEANAREWPIRLIIEYRFDGGN